MFLFKHSSPLRCSRCVCSGTHKVVSNTSCFFFYLSFTKEEELLVETIFNITALNSWCLSFEQVWFFFFFLIKKTSLNLFTQRFQISNFNFQCKREKYSQSLHKKKAWNSYHVLNFLRTLVKWDQAFEHTEAAELQKRESPTQVCPFAKQANNKKKCLVITRRPCIDIQTFQFDIFTARN